LLIKKLVRSLFPDAGGLPKRLRGVVPFARDFAAYRAAALRQGKPLPLLHELYPCLEDRYLSSGNIPEHYFFQDLWAAKLVFESRVAEHYDIGSSIDGFISHISVFTRVRVLDIRPQPSRIENVEFIQGDILNLELENQSIGSLSCLHAAEHIGLGRYGDPLDPLGTEKAARELQRVLAVGGNLYFSLPVGRERTCFNAHRVLSPVSVLGYFDGLQLASFSVVDDSGAFIRDTDPNDYLDSNYSCGLFHFYRKCLDHC